MSGHFRAFSFVDRILAIESGKRASARYWIPREVSAFPISLVAESVGQVACWVAMAATGFRRRPVAGLAGRIEILASAVQPGQTFDVAVELTDLDDDAVAYHGHAHVNGATILQADECVGPMLPAAEFDDPAALRERFELLCGAGAAPGGFPGVDPLPLQVSEEPGLPRRATLAVPGAAPFFADHFPRRPVVPGTLLLDAMFRLAALVAREADPGAGVWSPRVASGVKMRAFVTPGMALEIESRLQGRDRRRLLVQLGARIGDKSMASARVEMAGSVA